MTDYKKVAESLRMVLYSFSAERTVSDIESAIALCEAAAGSEDERAYVESLVVRWFKIEAQAEEAGVEGETLAEMITLGCANARAQGYKLGYDDASVILNNMEDTNLKLQAKYDALVKAATDAVDKGRIDRLAELLP